MITPSIPLATSTLTQCMDYCLITPTCNSVDFCDSASGCGEYCTDHNNRNPASKLE